MATTALNAELTAVKLGNDIHGKRHFPLLDKHRFDVTLGRPFF